MAVMPMLSRRITATGVLHRKPVPQTYPDGSPMAVPDDEWETEDLPIYTIAQVESDEPVGPDGRHEFQRIRVSTPLSAPKPGYEDRVSLPGFESGGLFHVDGEPAESGNHNPFLALPREFGGREIMLVRRRR